MKDDTSMAHKSNTRGFTIVELLIVIVVIGILASIVIVAFNGVQTRAQATKSVSELGSIKKAIDLYYVDNSSYPVSTGWSGLNHESNFVPGLVPKYMSSMPQSSQPDMASCGGSTSYRATYMYRSDASGANYKLIAHCDGLCETQKAKNTALIDPARDCWGYGYWTTGGASL